MAVEPQEKDVISSYLVELKPYVNKDVWKKATGDLGSVLKSSKVTYSDWEAKKNEYKQTIREIDDLEKRIKKTEALLKKANGEEAKMYKDLLGFKAYRDEKGKLVKGKGMYGELEKLQSSANAQQTDATLMGMELGKTGKIAGEMAKFASELTKVVGATTAVVNAFKMAYDKSMEIVEKAMQTSNKFNTDSAFVNMNVRGMRARYGVSATRANAMTEALGLLGLSENDIGRMNAAQRKAYDELVAYYEQGINKIDVDKMKEYNETMEEFQMSLSKWKMDLKTGVIKILAESGALKRLTGTLEKFFEKSIEFLESPAVQWFFDTFIEFLNGVMEIATAIIDAFSFGGGGSKVINNSTSTQSTNNIYVYGSDYDNSDSLARNIALKIQTGGAG